MLCGQRLRHTRGGPSNVFGVAVAIWLWFTVLFANLPEAWPRQQGRAASLRG
jgi:high-affinity K+ transport system ATPase subunit B